MSKRPSIAQRRKYALAVSWDSGHADAEGGERDGRAGAARVSVRCGACDGVLRSRRASTGRYARRPAVPQEDRAALVRNTGCQRAQRDVSAPRRGHTEAVHAVLVLEGCLPLPFPRAKSASGRSGLTCTGVRARAHALQRDPPAPYVRAGPHGGLLGRGHLGLNGERPRVAPRRVDVRSMGEQLPV